MQTSDDLNVLSEREELASVKRKLEMAGETSVGNAATSGQSSVEWGGVGSGGSELDD